MTPEEWGHIATAIVQRWPRMTLPKETLEQYGRDLAHLPGEHVAAAAESYYRAGNEWPPTGAQLGQAAWELANDVPAWGQVHHDLIRCLRRSPRLYHAGRWRNERQEQLERCHPLIAKLVEQVGWDEIGACPVDDRIAEAQLRTKWEQLVVRACHDSQLAGLPDAGLARISRVNRENPSAPRPIADALARIVGPAPQITAAPVAALPAPEPAPAEVAPSTRDEIRRQLEAAGVGYAWMRRKEPTS